MFGALGLRRAGTTAVDVDALLGAVRRGDDRGQDVLSALSRAVCGVLAAVVAFADPEVVVIGGTWGREPVLIDALAAESERLPRRVPIRAAQVADQPSLVGARNHALQELRTTITGVPGSPAPAR